MLTIPRTPLSMTYHATIAAYRDEMHHDLETSYRRFALDGSLAWLACGASSQPLPTPAQMRGATEKVDLAAFRRRKDGTEPELHQALEEFFALLNPVLHEELVKGVNAPNQPDNHAAHRHFLSALYHLYYSKAFRSSADGRVIFGTSYETGGIGPAWDAVRAALMGEPVDADLAGAVGTLCNLLKREFQDSIWVFCW